MPADLQAIAAAVKRVESQIEAAATLCGRFPSDIRLVAVTKGFGADAVVAAYRAGVRHFGENRVQEWEAKRPLAGELPGAVFHMIGHLQRNKARRAVSLFQRIDSVDKLALARRLDELAAEAERILPVLIEVRLSDEPGKSGIEPPGLHDLAKSVALCPHLNLRGLMAVPPQTEHPEGARPYFRHLRELRDDLASRLGHSLSVLSMGMSHDFEIGIEEGATEVRIGTGIFGVRAKQVAGNG
jgi:PLP dependent protein